MKRELGRIYKGEKFVQLSVTKPESRGIVLPRCKCEVELKYIKKYDVGI
jgi:hypothetical protein